MLQIHGSCRPCAYCDERFRTIYDLTKHIELQHGVEDPELSPSLANVVKPISNSTSHDSYTRTPYSYQCETCKLLFPSNNELVEHTSSAHRGVWSCDQCIFRFTTQAEVQEHKETEHAITFLTCSYCAYKCESTTHLKKHVAALHVNDTAEQRSSPDQDTDGTGLSSTSRDSL